MDTISPIPTKLETLQQLLRVARQLEKKPEKFDVTCWFNSQTGKGCLFGWCCLDPWFQQQFNLKLSKVTGTEVFWEPKIEGLSLSVLKLLKLVFRLTTEETDALFLFDYFNLTVNKTLEERIELIEMTITQAGKSGNEEGDFGAVKYSLEEVLPDPVPLTVAEMVVNIEDIVQQDLEREGYPNSGREDQ